MNGIVIALIVGVIIGIGSTVLIISVIWDTSSGLNLSDEEKKEIQDIIKKQCPNYPRSDAECASQWFTSIFVEKQLGL